MAKLEDANVAIHADWSPLQRALDQIRDALRSTVDAFTTRLSPVFAEFWHDMHVAWYVDQPWPVRYWHTLVGHRHGDPHDGPHA